MKRKPEGKKIERGQMEDLLDESGRDTCFLKGARRSQVPAISGGK